jgi:hypothetical protein
LGDTLKTAEKKVSQAQLQQEFLSCYVIGSTLVLI